MARRSVVGSSGDDETRMHPTRLALIETVVHMLETRNPEDVRIEEVLSQSGISSGSLYYHFESLPDLIDQAIIWQYSTDIDVSTAILAEVIANATDIPSLREGLRMATERAVSSDRAAVRFHRSQVMARAAANQRFREALVPHQERLNEAWAELFRQTQAKGLVDPDVDPAAGGLFVQAYSLGVVINDVTTGNRVDHDEVVSLVMRVLEKSFLTGDSV